VTVSVWLAGSFGSPVPGLSSSIDAASERQGLQRKREELRRHHERVHPPPLPQHSQTLSLFLLFSVCVMWFSLMPLLSSSPPIPFFLSLVGNKILSTPTPQLFRTSSITENNGITTMVPSRYYAISGPFSRRKSPFESASRGSH